MRKWSTMKKLIWLRKLTAGPTDFWDWLGNLIKSGNSTDIYSPGDTIDINWINTVTGTTSGSGSVSCTDADKFINKIGECEATTYQFTFDGTHWKYKNAVANLADYGLVFTGTPASGDVMTITTTVKAVNYTFTGYDDVTPADENVPHNWLLEQTYAPDSRVYDTYEALFAVPAGKMVPVGNYHLRNYSYRSGFYVDMYLGVTTAIGDPDSIIQMRSTGYNSGQEITNADGVTKTGVYTIKALEARKYGTTVAGTGVCSIAYAPESGVTYTELTSVDGVYVNEGQFDKCALGSNTWPLSNVSNWLNDDTASGSTYEPTSMLDIASTYNLGAGFLWGLDPRVKKIIQYAQVKWTAGYGNDNVPGHYDKASGTAPASDAPIYYVRSGKPGNRVYTALDPQPSAGDDVSSYYVYSTSYVRNDTYTDEQKVFMLSMKEMSYNLNTSEGNMTDLYGSYTNDTLTNNAVAARAKYNQSGGTVNNYRWSRSAYTGNASADCIVTAAGSHNSNGAFCGYPVAPAFIIGKS